MLVIDQLRKGDRPLQVLSLGILLGLGVLLAGLWYVQIVSVKKYQNSQVNQSVRTVRQPSIRGKIKDRHGELLADNRPNYVVNMYLDGLRKRFSEEYGWQKTNYLAANPGVKLSRTNIAPLQRTSRFLAASNSLHQLYGVLQTPVVIDRELEQKFTKHYEQSRSYPLLVMDQLTPTQIARFMEQGKRIPGLDLEIQPLRHYPLGQIAAHVVGHLGRELGTDDEGEEQFDYRVPDYVGRTGIEGTFDDDLRGTPGVKSIVINNALYRHEEQVIAEPLPGHDLWLTLDLGLQKKVEEELRVFGPETRGSAIVMDVRNGDLLAIVSCPANDPNVWLGRMSTEVYAKMNDPELNPQMNRSTSGAYAPGSIFKIISGLAALEAGIMTATNIYTKDTRKAPFRVGRREIHDTAPDGDYDFRRAFVRSSNGYFIHYGLQAGLEKILALGHQFSLGEKTDLPLGPEVSGYFPEYKDTLGDWSAGNVANVCMGQEILVTPIQMAAMVAAIANGGTLYWPRLVERLEPPEASAGEGVVRFPAGRVRRQIKVRSENLALVRHAMREDVAPDGEGTGRPADVPGMNVCGKTGTAQIKEGGRQVDKTTWFASFAPYEDPKYAVIVMIESGGSGGGTCAPIARKIYQAIQKRDPTMPPPRQGTIAANH